MATDTERPTWVRYRIIALIFVITAINYADRATFSIAGNAASNERPDPRGSGLFVIP